MKILNENKIRQLTKNEYKIFILGLILIITTFFPWVTLQNASEIIYIYGIEEEGKFVLIGGVILILFTLKPDQRIPLNLR